jgi:HK97 family phage major capsid protein
MNRLQEIETRLSAIKTEIDAEGADLEALETEINSLKEERAALLEKVEKRKKLLDDVNKDGEIIKDFREERKMEVEKMTREEIVASPEYRSAYIKNLLGRELNDAEKRSIAAANVSGAMPTQTFNEIISKIKQTVPLMNEITLLHVAGNVNFAIEGTNNSAAIHTENGQVTPATDTLVTVSLAGYEIVKIVRISATVKTMTIGAFETWLTDQLAEAVARVIENYIVNGNGTGQPKGIDYAQTWTDGTNAVAWAANNKPTYAELCELVGYLPGGYARNAKFLMNHKTFWGDIQSVRDDGKAPIVKDDNGTYRILGFPVLFSDYVSDKDIFLGDYKKVVGNLSQDIKVDSSESSGFIYNAVDYRGTAIFDCDIAVGEAIVKGAATL